MAVPCTKKLLNTAFYPIYTSQCKRSKAVIKVQPHLDVLSIRVHPSHQVHALLVHGEHNTTTHYQPCQARQRAAPKGQDTLLLENDGRATEAVPVDGLSLRALHASLDGIQRLRDVYCDEARDTANSKGPNRAKLLPWRRVRLSHLP